MTVDYVSGFLADVWATFEDLVKLPWMRAMLEPIWSGKGDIDYPIKADERNIFFVFFV